MKANCRDAQYVGEKAASILSSAKYLKERDVKPNIGCNDLSAVTRQQKPEKHERLT